LAAGRLSPRVAQLFPDLGLLCPKKRIAKCNVDIMLNIRHPREERTNCKNDDGKDPLHDDDPVFALRFSGFGN
jgi:hypothetical protein